MAAQWDRDPKTLDYIVQNGSPVNTPPGDLLVPALIRLRCPKNKWMYNPDLGSKLSEVKKNTMASPHNVELIETLAAQALKPMVDDGRALDIAAKVVEQGRAQGIGFVAEIIGKDGQPQVLGLPSVG